MTGSSWQAVRGYPLKAFTVCLVAYATAQMDLALFGYAIPSIRDEFDLSLSGVMSIVSSAFLLGGLLIVWLGVWTDRLGRRVMFQFSLIGSSFLVALHSIVPTAWTLALLRGSSIAVGGLSYPITGAIITEEFPARLRGLFMGLLQIGYPLGWALASLWAAWLLSSHGWRMLFLVGLISPALCAGRATLYPRTPTVHRQPQPRNPQTACSRPARARHPAARHFAVLLPVHVRVGLRGFHLFVPTVSCATRADWKPSTFRC